MNLLDILSTSPHYFCREVLILGFKGLVESILGRPGERVASLVYHAILPNKRRERMRNKAL